jgi:FAD:protein FMN transferase
MFDYTFERFTTSCTISLFDSDHAPNIASIAQLCDRLCSDVEQQCSRFVPDSTLSHLNRGTVIHLPEHLEALIVEAMRLMQVTQWRFNPFVSVATLWYAKSFDATFLPTAPIDGIPLSTAFQDIISYDADSHTACVKPWWSLDLWWIGKWYLVDCLGKNLLEAWYTNRIVNFGGDILVHGSPEANRSFCIAIDNPLDPGNEYGTLELSRGSLCTSWSYKRTWKYNEQTHHHIIDPYTWGNQRSIVSASVLSDDTVTSDGFATAVMTCATVEEWITLLETHWLDGLLIDQSGKMTTTRDFIQKYQYD